MGEFTFNTLLLHPNIENDSGATTTPIYQSSAFKHQSAESIESLFNNKSMGYCYTRITNPTINAFEKRVTLLENGIAGIAAASGMAAIFNTIVNVLVSGDELVSSPTLYGGTIDMFKDLAGFGITVKYAKTNTSEDFKAVVSEKTKLIFAETIGNPRLDVTDITALAKIAHEVGAILVIDNTVATPMLCKPLELGADIVIHSTSKYINGSSTAIGGIIVCGKKIGYDLSKFPSLAEYAKFGAMAFAAKLRGTIHQHVGATMAPQTAFLNNIGIETLALRMKCACNNAMKLAEFLNTYDDIKVIYLGLADNEYHELATKVLDGLYGAIITIRVGSKERAFKLINSLKIPMVVSNIGDTKTLVIHPASTISLNSTEQQKIDAGVFDDLIRISVGIEDADDLIKDFKNAIDKINEEE